MFPLKKKKEPSTFSHQELAGGMDSSWGVIKRDLAYLKKKKRCKNNSMKQCDKTQEPALRTVSGFLKHGGLLGLMFTVLS